MRVVDDGITGLVVVVIVVSLGFEGQVANELGVPSEDDVLEAAGCGETTESEVLDHPVEGAHEVIKLLLGVKSEGLDGVVHEGVLYVAHIFDGVVVVHHLGVVGVVEAEVRVGVTSQVADFNGAEGRSSLGTGRRVVEELTVVEVFGSLHADSGNSPVGDGEARTSGVICVDGLGEVVLVLSLDVRRGEGDLRGSPLSSSNVLGGAVLLVLGLHGAGALVLFVVEFLRFLKSKSERSGNIPVVECSQHSIVHASSGLNSGPVAVPGSGSKELDISDVVEVVSSTHGGDGGGGDSSGGHEGSAIVVGGGERGGEGLVVLESVGKSAGSNVDGEVSTNLLERGGDSLDHHVGVGLVGVVISLLVRVGVDAHSLSLGDAEGSLDGGPLFSGNPFVELEHVSRAQERGVLESLSRVKILVEKSDTILVGKSGVTSTLGNLRLSEEVHADVSHGVDRLIISWVNSEGGVVEETSSGPLEGSQVTVVYHCGGSEDSLSNNLGLD